MTIDQVQSHANERSVALSVKATKITARLLAKAMQAFLRKAKNPATKHGKQSVKSLTKQGASLDSVEISGQDIDSFKKVARKYNIDFALQKDSSTDPPKWVVFFKAKDSKALETAFKEFSKGILKPEKAVKPPMLDKLNKFKEIAKAVDTPAKDRNRGEVSL